MQDLVINYRINGEKGIFMILFASIQFTVWGGTKANDNSTPVGINACRSRYRSKESRKEVWSEEDN